MSEIASGTNGGDCGTSGTGARRRRLAWLALGVVVFSAVQSIANVESTIEDMARMGVRETRGHVWIWQLSSVAVWLALIPAIGWIVARARPPRFGWPMVIVLHAIATVPVSLAHVAAMVVLRKLAYAAGGSVYRFGPLATELLYEYRKDVATYLILAAFLAYAQWMLARPVQVDDAPRVLLVPDGSVTHRVPHAAIDWAASAGNYVEIGWGPRVLLHRSTLAALEVRLGSDFARIHRGRIVRRAAVERVETDKSGDFTVTLADGKTLRGSRRYRAGL